MKRLFTTLMLAFAGIFPAFSQPSPGFTNKTTITGLTNIDTTVFVNLGVFDMTVGSLDTFPATYNPFDGFLDTQVFTNRGTMSADTGWLFYNLPSSGGDTLASASFGNSSSGSIFSGSFTNQFVFESGTIPEMVIDATNVVNTGLLDTGPAGVIFISGQNVNLKRGTIHVEGFDDPSLATSIFGNFGGGFNVNLGALSSIGISEIGVFTDYWGIGMQTNHDFVNPPNPPGVKTTSAKGATVVNLQSVFLSNPNAYAFINQVNPSNINYQVVFVDTNLLNNFTADVRFFRDAGNPNSGFPVPEVQLQTVITNYLGGPTPITNSIYVLDYFGAETNTGLITNSFSLYTGLIQLAPTNYNILYITGGSDPNFTFGAISNVGYDPNAIFTANNAFPCTNQYAALGLSIEPVVFQPDPSLVSSTYSNLPGRVVISATNFLDLTFADLTGANYIDVAATNHFVGSANALIDAPFLNYNLGTTNGQLTVTNLVQPFLPRSLGTVDVQSRRWTNINNGITNGFHVLFVGSSLVPTSTPLIDNLILRSTNVVINDWLTVSNVFFIDAQNITIASNAPNAANTAGMINLDTSNFTPDSLPSLVNLTNWGSLISGAGALNLGVVNFLNHGSITSAGFDLVANYFENSVNYGSNGIGVITTNALLPTGTNSAVIGSSGGPFLIQANTTVLWNDVLISQGSGGDMSISTGSLLASNATINCSGALLLSITNSLNATTTGTGGDWLNSWTVANGFNLMVKPTTGDLLNTTVTDVSQATPNAEVDHVWAGNDFGPNYLGYSNNTAVGHLILDGGAANPFFWFTGASVSNAIYVDLLELRDFATNRSGNANGFTAIGVDTNMVVYFADAAESTGAGLVDISEKLNGSANGRLIWVPSYAGLFSSTNIVYPDGTTNTFNFPLAASRFIDSDHDGIANAFDPTPFFVSSEVNLSAHETNSPANTMVLTWQSLAYSTNTVLYTTNLAAPNWQVLTNFTEGTVNATATVLDPVRSGGTRYYKIKITPQQP